MRIPLDIPDEAYCVAKAIARDQNRSLGGVMSDLILQSAKGARGPAIEMSDYGFPTFRRVRPVSSEDVTAMEEQ